MTNYEMTVGSLSVIGVRRWKKNHRRIQTTRVKVLETDEVNSPKQTDPPVALLFRKTH
jgi:hypothetical protein